MTAPRLDRRQALAALGGAGLGVVLIGCGDDDAGPGSTAAAPESTGPSTTLASGATVEELFAQAGTCTLTPEQTEGPFYFDPDAIRQDVREDRAGTPLRLAIRVQAADRCEPIRDAVVEIWQCDAEGTYSGFASGAPPRSGDAAFLRGAQVTDDAGVVEFVTVYPGWYPGRTVHIHAKAHPDSSTVLTTQLYLDDSVTDAVHRADPYAGRGERDVRNGDDSIFDPATLLTLSEADDGYLGVITFGVESA